MKFVSALLFVLTVAVAFNGRTAFANEVNNGGDYVAAEFVARGYVVLGKLRALQGEAQILSSGDTARLALALEQTRVASIDAPVFLDADGVPCDARNAPDPDALGARMIELKRSAWLTLLSDHANVYRLIFHEYLRILGIDDDNYKVSHRLTLTEGETIEVRTCGVTGSIAERVTACGLPVELGGFGPLAVKSVPANDPSDPFGDQDSPAFFVWRLVTRDAQKKQLWLDEATGVVWSACSDLKLPNSGANSMCRDPAQGRELKAGLPIAFQLPSYDDVQRGALHGLLRLFASQCTFWTSTQEGAAWLTSDGWSFGREKARCIATEREP